ncbi:MAG: hypothetical protein KDA61_19005 [Planctomycetales bacterium]|nr:hypothetical protein [Planctomycetales bacterium]
MGRNKAFSDQLRDAIAASAKSRYQIHQETGIEQSGLSRFVNQGAGLAMASIDALVECLGLQLVPIEKAKESKRRPKA